MISIIMPTYNRFDIVQETIHKTIAINSPIEFELIVVNDGEPLPFTITHPTLSIFKNPKKGASTARNFGAALAKYDILFFIDDDMWITAESLSAIDKLHKSLFFEKKCVNLNWQYPDALIQKMKQEKVGRYLLQANYHTMEGRSKLQLDPSQALISTISMGSCSFVIQKSVFNAIGKYNEQILFQGEDIELSKQLKAHTIAIFTYVPITCFHNQQDRLNIQGWLDRDKRGYESQFKFSKKEVAISPLKLMVYTGLSPFFSLILILFHAMPNNTVFDKITFKLIGMMTAINYYKAWRNAPKN